MNQFHGRSKSCLQKGCIEWKLPVLFYKFCDNISKLSVHSSWFAYFHGLLQALVSFSDQKFARFCNLADQVGLIEVHMHSILVNSHVQIYNISIFKRSIIRNAVANYFVYWGT